MNSNTFVGRLGDYPFYLTLVAKMGDDMTVSLRHIVGFVVFLWVAVLFYDALMAPPPVFVFGEFIESERSRTLLLLVAAMLASNAALIILMRPSYIPDIAKASAPNALIFALTLILALQGILHGSISAISYSFFFFSVIVITFYINQCFSETFYLAVSVALVFSLIGFLIYHGSPIGRWIGGIHPNHVGAFAFAAAYFAARSGSRGRWLVYAIGILFSILVSSRYAVVAIFTIVFFDYLHSFRLSYTRVFWSILVIFVAFFVAIMATEFIFNDVLFLNDYDRGLGSGMSGRVDMWGDFWSQFVQRPFIGYGFRNRGAYEGTHNGFLNFVLENGAIAFFVLAGVVFAKLWRSVSLYIVGREPREIIRFGLWVAWLFAAFLMPQLINFGDAFALITVFLLTDDRKLREI